MDIYIYICVCGCVQLQHICKPLVFHVCRTRQPRQGFAADDSLAGCVGLDTPKRRRLATKSAPGSCASSSHGTEVRCIG